MGRTAKQVIVWALYAWVGIAFAYAGILKLLDLEQFVSSILTYSIFDFGQAVVIACWIPPLEILAGLGILAKRWRAGGVVILSVLLFVFLVMIIQAFVRGLEIDCGCFGDNAPVGSGYWGLIVRDTVMLLSLLLAPLLEKRWLK